MELSQFKTVEQLAAAIKSQDMVTSVSWRGYHDASTIVGWSAYTAKLIYYKKIGKLMFVQFYIDGTSDDTVATFTIPHTPNANPSFSAFYVRSRDDNVWLAQGLGLLTGGNATIQCYTTSDGALWTNSSTKTIVGQFWYEAA